MRTKRYVTLLLCLALAALFAGCGDGVPEGKQLTAAPTGAPVYADESAVMPIGGWVMPVPTRENFLTAKEAGLNFFHNVNRDFSGQGVGELDATMKLLEECGLKGYVQLQGQSFTEYQRNKFHSYSSFAGFNFYDEPSAKIFDALKEEGDAFHKRYPGKQFFANLFPNYASAAQLGTDTFAEYVSSYVETVPCDILSYDFYPLVGSGTSSKIDTGWLSSLEVMGNAAKRKDIPFWSFLQCMSYGANRRAPKSAADITLQIYTNLCYGVKGLQYFCYMSPAIGPEFTSADVGMIDRSNQKTPIYDYVKAANDEILGYDHVLLGFDWENTMPVYGSAETQKNSAFKALKAPLTESAYFADAQATRDTLIGQFKDASGYTGLLLVNYTDPASPVDSEISLRCNADRALVFEGGVAKTVTLEGGIYRCTLESGEGRFVIPYNEQAE